jgi:pimeloyl-ACP methyl ester carboxylesterase
MGIWQKSLIIVAGAIMTLNVTANEYWDAWGREIWANTEKTGLPKEQLRRIFENMDTIEVLATGPGSWVYELKSAGDVYHRKAQEQELTGSKDEVLRSYTIAHELYNYARFPQLFTEDRHEAYRLMRDTFFKITKLKGIPMEEVRIPYQGKEIVGHFYNTQDKPAPLIIWSGGTDGWKMAGLDFKQRLLNEGFAIFAMDMPGTGESQHKLSYKSDLIYGRVIDYFKNEREDIDGDKIATYFGSFSGNFAVKLALTNKDLAASVNHSGGIHHTFTMYREMGLKELPPTTTSPGMRAAATMYAMGFDVDDYDIEKAMDTLEELSLKNQKLLKKTPSQVPLLSIYGTADILMPERDWELLKNSGVETEGLIYEGDRHMAWEHADDHRPKMIAWLKEQLKMN